MDVVNPISEAFNSSIIRFPATSTSPPQPIFKEDHDDRTWEDREDMISAFASFGQEKQNLRKSKSLSAERDANGLDIPKPKELSRRSVEVSNLSFIFFKDMTLISVLSRLFLGDSA